MFLQSVHICLLKEDIPSADTLRVKMAIVNIAHTEIQESRFEDDLKGDGLMFKLPKVKCTLIFHH